MTRALVDDGAAEKRRLRAAILARHFVRLHMTLIVLASVASAVLASKALLAVGVGSMMVRYPLNCLVAYLVFLSGVRLWLRYAGFDQGAARRRDSLLDGAGPDGGDFDFGSFGSPRGGGEVFGGKGGEFGGGGASESFAATPARTGGWFSGSGGSGGGGFDLDGDGVVVIVLLLLVVAAVVGAGGYVIYQAPSILADAAFQMLLAGGLMKRTRRMSESDWAGSVFKATWMFLAAILALALAFAAVAHHAYPQAHTMGEVLRMAQA